MQCPCPSSKSRALLSLRLGRAATSSSCQPTGPLGLLPAFSLPVFSPCLSAPEPRSSHTAAIQHFLVAAAEHTQAGCCRQCGRALPGGCREVNVLGREMNPISLDHPIHSDLEQVAKESKSISPTNKTKKIIKCTSKGVFFLISD